VEEANSGDSCCSDCEALWRVFPGDPTQCVYGDRSCGLAGLMQAVQSGSWEHLLAGNGFFEDRSEENCRRMFFPDLGDIG
jgi:hypothetical protein